MKIVNIHYTGYGGLAQVVHGLASARGAHAFEWVMAYYGVAALDKSHSDFCRRHGFRYAIFRPEPRRPFRAWVHLARWLVRECPDAIICHSTTAIPASIVAARLCKVPLIVVEHTPNEVKSRHEWAGSFAGMLLADRVVLLTNVYAKYLATTLGPIFSSKKIRCIPNGLDTCIFYPRSNQATINDPLRVGMAARLAPTKLQDLLIDVADDIGMALELAGDGETMDFLQCRAAIKPAAEVYFKGLVPASEMPGWFRGLDLYVHASKGETFSMSILQAMATGLPIIASDISGMDEILGIDGSCGLLVPNTHTAWRDAIKKLINNPRLRKSMGVSARKRALSLFSSEAMMQGYVSVIDEISNDGYWKARR